MVAQQPPNLLAGVRFPSEMPNYVGVTRKARGRIANPFYAGSIPVTYSITDIMYTIIDKNQS